MDSSALLSLLNTLICIFVFVAAPFACNIESAPLAPRRVTSGNGKATATKMKIKKKKNVEGQKTKWLRAGQGRAAPSSSSQQAKGWSSASISCRVNFNLQLFCDRRFGQHESPETFSLSSCPFFCILQRYTYFFVSSFLGYLAVWLVGRLIYPTRLQAVCRLGAARLPLVLMTARADERTNGPGLIAAAAHLKLCFISVPPRLRKLY